MKAANSEVVQPKPGNPGESLRQAREARGLSVAEVAAQLNLTQQRLNQIEAGAFDKLPGTTFARGYVRAYAKLLELDQNRLVMEFDQFTGADSAGSDVHSLGRIEEPARYSQSILRLFSFVLLLALIGAGFLWWQERGGYSAGLADLGLEHVEVEGADGRTQVHSLAEPEDQAVIAAQVNEPDAALPLPIEGEQAEAATMTEGEEAQLAITDSAAPAEITPLQAEAPQTAVAPVEPVKPAAGEGILVVQYVADCWTQVTDANGKVLLSELKRKGDRVELTGKAPMELRLGFARGAQVSYNGEAVDVSTHTTGETARLKLGL
ncbi:RodZ family helix-turn-helix domain-containing protein [Pseudomonas sp. NCCP-436]|uniref:RodZ domain-containing protein n=1 Tax=Pseudomonas sp. NCCP-436 TaxID=2842481 RepID=UPI001C822949|nr:RodZ family helix-turn-helix domain-containing protein [Pseudomonas sp. NCCP-436]GIZ13662.1 helix-turn-helix domain-containing protein [Pseudomonas sp. NCCP-436]